MIIGREEWLALPGLGLPAIKAKIDTGTRTSALHVSSIDTYGPIDRPMVHLRMQPVAGRPDIVVASTMPLVGRREVTSSNGETESRYVIETTVQLAGRCWPIEIGLANRRGMAYRMLLGRQAIAPHMMVDPAQSFCQERLSYDLYRVASRRTRRPRELQIALVARDPESPSSRMLSRAAQARGHVLTALDLSQLEPSFGADGPGLRYAGAPITQFDAVIPRVGPRDGRIGAAVVRQLEMMGSFAINSGDALDRRASRIATLQALSRSGVSHRLPSTASQARVAERGRNRLPSAAGSARLSCLVVGDEVAAVLHVHPHAADEAEVAMLRTLARRAARALDLELAAVDIDIERPAPQVIGVSARPSLERFARQAGRTAVDCVVQLLERRVNVAADARWERNMRATRRRWSRPQSKVDLAQ